MKHSYASTTYIDAADRFDSACDWLNGLGIRYSTTRVGKYQRILRHLASCQSSGALGEFYSSYPFEVWVNAALEAAEIVRIHDGLSGDKNLGLVEKIREAIRGHELYVLDNSDRSGRDFSLELVTAAKFASAGYRVDLTGDADVSVMFGAHPLYVECKRIKSPAQINKRLKEGVKQLHRRYVACDIPRSARGILVVSISRLVNADMGLLEAKDDVELGDKATYHNMKFIDAHKAIWQHQKMDGRTLGVAVLLDVPGILLNKNRQLVTCHEISLNNSVPPSSENHALLMQIARKVFAGERPGGN
ncbi:MAG: hypothetical protein ACOY9J_00760 [Pseudomonadota bacterium]